MSVTASLSVQGVSSELDVDATERFWLNGILFGDAIPVGSYNATSNLTLSDDTDPIEIRNVAYAGANTAAVDAVQLTAYGGSTLYGLDTYGGDRDTNAPITVGLPLDQNFCQFHVNVTSDDPIAITSASFYAYDGINDTVPFPHITFYAVEAGVSSAWVTANGSTQALVCSNQASATNHDWFIAVSASPAATGDKQGKIKFVYTYA